MFTTIEVILTQPLFEKARVAAGKDHLNHTVNRVSVFDCPVKDTLLDNNIIETGDLFLSTLEQFVSHPDCFMDFITLLIEAKSSGLFIVGENTQLITPEIAGLCEMKGFPVVVLDKNIPYAAIMDAINKLTTQEYRHMLNGLKLNSLRNNHLSKKEKVHILNTINPQTASFIQLFILSGEEQSFLTQNELSSIFLSRNTDIYIFHDNLHYFIFSDETEHQLDTKTRTNTQYLLQFFRHYNAGISMIHKKEEIDQSLNEARLSHNASFALNEPVLEYDSGSLLQLITLLEDKEELFMYRNTLLQKINAIDSENDMVLFETLKEFVRCRGSYQTVAHNMNQHENTIRYRINKIRQVLGMEDNIILFHTTLFMLATIDSLQ